MKIKLKNTKLVSTDKTPLTLYRSTPDPVPQTGFKPLSHFGTKVAAHMRTMHFVYQALNIPEPVVLPSELPKSLLNAFHKKSDMTFTTYSVHLHMKSSLRMPDVTHHNLAGYYRWFCTSYKPKSQFLTFTERMEGDVVGPEKIKYKQTLAEFIFLNPFTRSESELKRELSSDSLYHLPLPPHITSMPAFLAPVLKQARSLPFELPEHVAFQRMIRFLEGEGYDGFVYRNDYEDKGNDSYIIFRPWQVFMANSDTSEHEVVQPTPQSRSILQSVEDSFFNMRPVSGPAERIFLHRQMLNKSARTRQS